MENPFQKKVRCQKGQGLVEYLIIVALMAAAAIGIVRVLSQNTRAQFANVSAALRGESQKKEELKKARETDTDFRDMSEFMKGASDRE